MINSILEHNLIPAHQLVLCTSSKSPEAEEKFAHYISKGIQIRYSNYNEPSSMVHAFSACTKILLISSPDIKLDFKNPPEGKGREAHHMAAIMAAEDAGVERIYYTSLAFGALSSHSKARVMRAHLLTERYLESYRIQSTIIREGLYNESWPLYLGFYFGLKEEERQDVVVAGDGAISFTSILDLGLATALILTSPSERYIGERVHLSQPRAVTLQHLTKMVSDVKGKDVGLKVVDRGEFCRYYVEEKGMDKDFVEWWSTTYEALKDNECLVEDATLTTLLASKGVTPTQIEATIMEMLN